MEGDIQLLLYDGVKKKTRKKTQVYIKKIFERKIVNIFLLISFNICFGCSNKPSH